jgi:hypothetical protein
MRRLDSWASTCFCLSLAVAGCSGRGTVSGKVTYQNQPLEYGSVAIAGADGIPRTARLHPGGLYTVADVPCGEARVSVHCPDPAEQERVFQDEQIKLQKGIQPPPDRKAPALDRDKWVPIPAHYGDFNNSGLKLTVQRGDNPFDIDLQ